MVDEFGCPSGTALPLITGNLRISVEVAKSSDAGSSLGAENLERLCLSRPQGPASTYYSPPGTGSQSGHTPSHTYTCTSRADSCRSDRTSRRSGTRQSPHKCSHWVDFPWHKNTAARSASAYSRTNTSTRHTRPPSWCSSDSAARRSSSPKRRRRTDRCPGTCRCCTRFAWAGSASSCGTARRPRPTRRSCETSRPRRSPHRRRRSSPAGCTCSSACTGTARPCTCGFYLEK